jgi:hypothetical protein
MLRKSLTVTTLNAYALDPKNLETNLFACNSPLSPMKSVTLRFSTSVTPLFRRAMSHSTQSNKARGSKSGQPTIRARYQKKSSARQHGLSKVQRRTRRSLDRFSVRHHSVRRLRTRSKFYTKHGNVDS